MNELISVIIPTFGRTNTLIEAIDSVLSQTYSNLEIIVVDDNADTELREIIDNIIYRFGDSRIICVHNSENLGGAESRNVGIRCANGDYIAFLDDDDLYLPEKLEKQMQLFKHNASENLGLVYCYDKAIDNHRNIKYTHKNDFCGNCLFEAMYDCIASTSLWLCKKKVLIEIGGFRNIPCKQDSYLLVELLANGYQVDRVPEILAIYRHDKTISRISTSKSEIRIEGEESLREL